MYPIKSVSILSFCFLLSIVALGDDYACNILDYGAVSDGKTINTEAIQNAIDKCSEKGGMVIIPAGEFLTGTIYLKSNVTLHLSENSTLLGSTNISDYPHNHPE
ncbi:MAG: glycosyl hydrolase family 28-related protein [Draconibacterium sp.]